MTSPPKAPSGAGVFAELMIAAGGLLGYVEGRGLPGSEYVRARLHKAIVAAESALRSAYLCQCPKCAAPQPAEQPQEWMPIETAPPSLPPGKGVLIYCNGLTCEARPENGQWKLMNDDFFSWRTPLMPSHWKPSRPPE